MTNGEARAWISARFDVPRETLLQRFVDLIEIESTRQNLVSRSSLSEIWGRHIVDSAQLVSIADDHRGTWIDIGTGAGFPGVVVAVVTDRPVILIEPRRMRAAFLEEAIRQLSLESRVKIFCGKAEAFHGTASVISARAVAALPELLSVGAHLSTQNTQWILPKGAHAAEEVASARQSWHGVFHVKQSITDPQSQIITVKGVSRR